MTRFESLVRMPGREVSRWKYLQCSVQRHELCGRSAMVWIRFDNHWLLLPRANQTVENRVGEQIVRHSSAVVVSPGPFACKSDFIGPAQLESRATRRTTRAARTPCSGKCGGLVGTCSADTQVSFRRLKASLVFRT